MTKVNVRDIIIKKYNLLMGENGMRSTVYTTSKYGEYIKKTIFSGEPLSGITTVSISEKPSTTDFLGFGVRLFSRSGWSSRR